MNSTCTVDLLGKGPTSSQALSTGLWHESREHNEEKSFGLSDIAKIAKSTFLFASQTVTAMTDPWFQEQRSRDAVVTVRTEARKMLISELGWTREQALETRMRLRAFEEDWNAPGMEGYDDL